jgi:hypothetical protein
MSPYIVRADGTIIPYPPKNPKSGFKATELQAAVGGCFTVVHAVIDGNPVMVLMDEVGALKDSPVNHVVTNMTFPVGARPWVQVWGDVLICNPEDLPPSKPQES